MTEPDKTGKTPSAQVSALWGGGGVSPRTSDPKCHILPSRFNAELPMAEFKAVLLNHSSKASDTFHAFSYSSPPKLNMLVCYTVILFCCVAATEGFTASH